MANTTVVIDGQRWRSLVRPAGTTRVQVLRSLADLDRRWADNRRLVALATALSALVAAAATWLVAGRLLRPLQRLRAAAGAIGPTDTTPLPATTGPREVADLTAALNAMLRRLHESMAATRRFTGDAGHEMRTPLASLGMDLETLRANPTLPEEQRRAALHAMAREHARLVALLEGLQTLARGDAGALPAREPVELVALLVEAVGAARARHPEATIGLATPPGPVVVVGWSTGLRLAVDNLLENATRHGRPYPGIEVCLSSDEPWVRLVVADDGPGIPVAARDALRQRFTRGPAAGGPGSGLGLALVDQQASLHRGVLELGDSPTGGLRATLLLPVARADYRQRS